MIVTSGRDPGRITACEAVVRSAEASTCTAVSAVAPSGQLNLSAVAAPSRLPNRTRSPSPTRAAPAIASGGRENVRCLVMSAPLSDVFLALSYTSHEEQGNRQAQYRFLGEPCTVPAMLAFDRLTFCSGGIVAILKLIWSLPSKRGSRRERMPPLTRPTVERWLRPPRRVSGSASRTRR
jgi:hypothetical protein